MYDFIIVGSGLTGILATEELLSQGRTVLMLDIGEEPDSRAMQLRQSSALEPPGIVSEQILKTFSDKNRYGAGRRQKLWFGDQVLERWKKYWAYRFGDCAEVGPATLMGGYSRVWGATCMPPDVLKHLGDLISPQESNGIVEDVLAFLGARESSAFTVNSRCQGSAVKGIVEKFVDRYRSKCAGSEFDRWRITPSLLATNLDAPECTQCGNCLLGCPIDLIFCATQHIDRLKSRPGFHYIGQQKCVSVTESANGASVNCIDLSSSALSDKSSFTAKRVLLAAGPLATTEILSNSISDSSEIRMLTSQLFSFPIFSTKLKDLVEATPGGDFGMSEAVLYEMSDSRPSCFMQLYSSNRVLRYYGAETSWSSMFLEGFLGEFLDRILVACQGYLDSDESPSLFMTNPGNGRPLELTGESPKTNSTVSEATEIFKKCGYATGKVKMHPAGDGFHFGGSFPMANNGGMHSSDMLGRPHGTSRIHVIDASVLPFIPAGPFTTFSLWSTLRITRGILREIE